MELNYIKKDTAESEDLSCYRYYLIDFGIKGYRGYVSII